MGNPGDTIFVVSVSASSHVAHDVGGLPQITEQIRWGHRGCLYPLGHTPVELFCFKPSERVQARPRKRLHFAEKHRAGSHGAQSRSTAEEVACGLPVGGRAGIAVHEQELLKKP